MTLTAAADVGASAAWALVEARPGQRPLLRLLVEVHGVRWHDLAIEGAQAIVDVAGACACWIEVPHSTVHRGAGMAHHATGAGLGRRIGWMEAAWHRASGQRAQDVLPGSKAGQWWRPFGLKKKRPVAGLPDGYHRIAEAELYVEGARARLAAVRSVERRVDAAESILIAAAMGAGQ